MKMYRCYSKKILPAREMMDPPLRRLKIITFTWMQWVLGWDVVVYNLPFKHATYKKQEHYTIN